MSEVPAAPLEPTPAPAPPVSPRGSRRRLVVGVAAGLTAVAAFFGVQFALNSMNANAITLYTSEEERYSVMAPGEPTAEQDGIVLPLGLPKTATHWTDGELYYSVSSADSEDLPPTPPWTAMFLHDLLVGALSDAPGVSASSLDSSAVADAFSTQPEEITMASGPAVQFTLALEGVPAPFHVIVTGRESTIYMLVYSDSADSRDEDFIDSFTFLD